MFPYFCWFPLSLLGGTGSAFQPEFCGQWDFRSGGRNRMRRVFGFSLSLLALISLSAGSIEAGSSSKTLATISGIVTDNKGNPLAGALVSLMREGAVKQTVKHTLTDRQGKFVAKVTPGRYGIKAIATGFGEVAFNAVDVQASQELVYKFNLEPVGYGNTLPERRRDRDDVKWTRSEERRVGKECRYGW